MIEIKEKAECCGCNACGDACPKGAITFPTDFEGFWYPEVDEAKCIDCGVCEKVCPVINVSSLKKNGYKTPKCYAANHKNLEIRFDSTSGGAFSALADVIYKQGGFVGGAIYNEDFSATMYLSSEKTDLPRLRSSKYLQADAVGFYNAIRDALKTEKPVLVCGTPCQMAALRSFLRKDYANLYIMDFICNSVASPKAHRKYFDYLEEVHGCKVIKFKAKNKELGWRSLTKKSTFADGKSYWGIRGKDCYSRAYHSHMISRPSCYSCPFKGSPRIADITVADFWGAEKVAKELDNNIGTSAVVCNNKKGEDLFKLASKKMTFKEINLSDIVNGNPAWSTPLTAPNFNRNLFYEDLERLRFDELSGKYFPIKEPSALRVFAKTLITFKNMTQMRPKPMWQFIRYNFLHSAVHTNWRKGHLLFPSPYCVIEVDKSADVRVQGAVLLGNKRFQHSKLESRFCFERNSKVEFQGNFRFGYGCDVEVFHDAEFICGANSGGNLNLVVVCGKKIHIGSHTFYGRDVSIRDYNGGHTIGIQGFKDYNPVIIGDVCWICSESKIMPGVKIGEGSVVGSNSVVIAPVPNNVLVSGNPAKVIETNIQWKH